MTTSFVRPSSFAALPSLSVMRRLRAAAAGLCVFFVAACGGGADAPPPAEGAPVPPAPPAAVAPAITQQPADLSVVSGQPASFTVAASGTAPLAYQWQRNGAAITGATAATYSIANTAPTDTGAVFRAVVSNVAGNATSNNATLTVTTAPPVLTITQQPANATVTAGAAATFTVAATCSGGTLQTQWQRLNGSAFADIGEATAATYALMASSGDSGAQFRASLSCSGQSAATSSVATLTVTAPPTGGILTELKLTGLRNQADIDLLTGIVRESSGSFAFVSRGTIRRLSADLSTITLIAGSSTDSSVPPVDGVGTAARFANPTGITVDAAGNLYIVDKSDYTVRRIATDGTVTTIAGQRNSSGSADGTGTAARFLYPNAIAIGPDGDLYVSDGGNNTIRRVTSAGVVTTYAGSTYGYVDGAPTAAQFSIPQGIAVAADGTVYVADAGNGRIRRILRSGNAAGNVDTLAGGASLTSPIDGTGAAAGIVSPGTITLVGNTLFVRDAFGLVRAVDITTRAVTTTTGNATALPVGVTVGYADGPRGTGRIDNTSASGIAAIGDGRLLLTDNQSGAIRLVANDGYIKSIATSAAYEQGFIPGTSTLYDHFGVGVLVQQPILFNNTRPALGAAPDGSIVVGTRPVLRRVAQDGSVTPIAGLVGGGFFPLDGPNSEAAFSAITAVAVKADGTIAVFDATAVRTVAPITNTVTTLAGPSQFGVNGSVDGTGAAARFYGITSMVYAANGDILAADTLNYAIRRITPAGVVTTFAGSMNHSFPDTMGQPVKVDGPAGTARFEQPTYIALAPDGILWVADKGSSTTKLRKVLPDGSVSTFEVTGVDLTYGTTALAFDPAGNLFLLSDGLYQLNTTTGVATRLIPTSQNGTTFGSSPTVGAPDRLIATGVKQLVLEDVGGGYLLRATLP